MATGLSNNVIEQVLKWMTHEGTATQPGDPKYIQWHTTEPGDNGTVGTTSSLANRDTIAGTTPFWNYESALWTANYITRSSNTTAGESSASTGDVTITHFSVWDAATLGNFLFSGTTTSQTLTSGDKLPYAIGALIVQINGAV